MSRPKGGHFGRRVQFDERSRAHPAVFARRVAAPIVTKTWLRNTAALNQLDLGSCTGNAAVGLLATAPFHIARHRYTQALARKVYSLATKLDPFAGEWPTDDTGSSILAAMKALQQLKYITSYQWCFGLEDVLRTLSYRGPVAIGINWYEGMDSLGRVSGRILGGHAIEVLGVNAEAKTVTLINSWGPTWGLKGRFSLSWDDLERLLYEDGEACTITL